MDTLKLNTGHIDMSEQPEADRVIVSFLGEPAVLTGEAEDVLATLNLSEDEAVEFATLLLARAGKLRGIRLES